jgi:hypothetical protein
MTTPFDLPDQIPLPGDSMGVDMDIADIVVPGEVRNEEARFVFLQIRFACD